MSGAADGVVMGREPLAGWLVEAMPLFRAHWEEVANWRAEIPLDVDVERALDLERAGVAQGWTVRIGGRLRGYLLALVMPHLHYRSTLHAHVDIVYLDPALRGSGCAAAFLGLVLEDLRVAGVRRVTAHVKHQADFSPLLRRFGFCSTETTWEALL